MAVKALPKNKGRTIELDGQFGKFFIGNSSIHVCYFSTYASPNSREGGHASLLEELSPMRERVSSSEMKSLDSLLQRDLSDERIALDLIPYLEGKFSSVGFFPPILAVLMPKGFIQGKNKVEYPDVDGDDFNDKYSNCWHLEKYPQIDDGEEMPSRLGRLNIFVNNADIIVIDGQHRSNAFRYVADCFSVDDTYKPFYSGTSKFDNYSSDLPVTIIWFEKKVTTSVIQPTDISRELFVAVNNSAKPVSQSRTVLLDEVNVTSLAVNTYYDALAQDTKFNTPGISLLTAAFDTSSEHKKPKMSITDPRKLNLALTYSFFGNSRYDGLSDRADRHQQNNTDRFKKVFGKEKFYEHPERGVFRITDSQKRKKFRELFRDRYKPVLDLLFSEKYFLSPHYQGIIGLENWVHEEKTEPEYLTLWDKVYCGGEGLYHAYITSEINACKQKSKYLKKMDQHFLALRYENIKESKCRGIKKEDVDRAYNTYDTEAHQIGFLMFVDYIFRNYEYKTLSDATKYIEEVFSKIKICNWIRFFTSYKSAVIGPSMDPNHWPLFQKMYVRFVEHEFEEAFLSANDRPDYTIVTRLVDDYYQNFFDLNEDIPQKEDVEKQKDAWKNELKKLNKEIGVKDIPSNSINKIIRNCVESANKSWSS